jgi:hypothetical protein
MRQDREVDMRSYLGLPRWLQPLRSATSDDGSSNGLSTSNDDVSTRWLSGRWSWHPRSTGFARKRQSTWIRIFKPSAPSIHVWWMARYGTLDGWTDGYGNGNGDDGHGYASSRIAWTR